MYPYMLTPQTLSIVIDSKQYCITSDHESFYTIIDLIKNDKPEEILTLISIKDKISSGYVQGNILIGDDDLFYYKGLKFNNSLTDKIISMYRDGFPITPMINFLDNIMLNPSQDSIDELYDFLIKGQLPITDDGCFLAYKKVNNDFTDCHTGKIDNSVGSTIRMDRSLVDDNRNNTCSTGLHFCSLEYLTFYSDDLPTMILKINPKDVVSIPKDYNNTKGRCCEYLIEAQYSDVHKKQFESVVSDTNIIKMNIKQKLVYSLVNNVIMDTYISGEDINDVDLTTLISDDKDTYNLIITSIINEFPNPISRSTAVKYFKFIKENFGYR